MICVAVQHTAAHIVCMFYVYTDYQNVLVCITSCHTLFTLPRSTHYLLMKALYMKLTCMQEHQDDKIIVYFLTCASVDFFHSALTQLPNMKAAQLFALHGKMKQAAREAVMSSYTGSPAGTANP